MAALGATADALCACLAAPARVINCCMPQSRQPNTRSRAITGSRHTLQFGCLTDVRSLRPQERFTFRFECRRLDDPETWVDSANRSETSPFQDLFEPEEANIFEGQNARVRTFLLFRLLMDFCRLSAATNVRVAHEHAKVAHACVSYAKRSDCCCMLRRTIGLCACVCW